MIVLITSCIFPQIGTSRLSCNPTTRAAEVIEASLANISSLLTAGVSISEYVLIEMMSPILSEQSYFWNNFAPSFKKHMAATGINGRIIGVGLNEESIASIQQRGKGYAEMLLLREFFLITETTDHILKISGRYEIRNIVKFCSSYLDNPNKFGIARSDFLRKAIAHCAFFNREAFMRFESMYGQSLDDRYLTLEMALYKYNVKNKSEAVRLKYPAPSPQTQSGATGMRYGYFKNILRCILYGYL